MNFVLADLGPPLQQKAQQALLQNPDARQVLERYGLLVLFVLVVLYFSFVGELAAVFRSRANIDIVLGNQSVLAILALAAVIPLIGGQFDLSVGPVLGLSSIATAAALSRFGAPVLVAVLVGVAIGAAVGLVNGALIAKVGVNSLITTLGCPP